MHRKKDSLKGIIPAAKMIDITIQGGESYLNEKSVDGTLVVAPRRLRNNTLI